MKLSLNREFFLRHLFVAVLMLGLGCWFGYDGFVGYPSKTPSQLYEMIEKSAPPSPEAAQKVYDNAIPRQKQFMGLALLASLAIGLHLLLVSRLDFEFDADGFTWGGKRFTMADIARIDDSRWEKKQICVIFVKGGGKLVLDAWHHVGVKDFHEKLKAVG